MTLLHFDGSNGSTDIVDVMRNTWTANGGAKLVTADSKFGGSCLALDGDGDFVSMVGSLAFYFEAWDFTIEAWVKPTNAGREMVMVDHYLSGQATWQVLVTSAGLLSFYGWNGSTTNYIVSGTSSLWGAWHHIAVSKRSGVVRLFVDGVLENSVPHTASFTAQPSYFALGAQVSARNAAYDYAGLMDEVRVIRGSGLYESTFSPPVEPFSDETRPVVLKAVLPLPIAPAAASFSGVVPVLNQRLYRNFNILGAEARLIGTVKEKHTPTNTPLRSRVRLIRERDGATVGETWSDATTGSYVFTNIDSAEAYTVIAYDHAHNYRAVVADNLTVAGGGVELVA
ncbi:LamG domain-containing protein [Variovorax sp. LT1R20]|uniref:LamG domain-containing protein n=1 Tax=Variovorax sp. LT1R20 TaxID=3443729 RepID=UPI003F446634